MKATFLHLYTVNEGFVMSSSIIYFLSQRCMFACDCTYQNNILANKVFCFFSLWFVQKQAPTDGYCCFIILFGTLDIYQQLFNIICTFMHHEKLNHNKKKRINFSLTPKHLQHQHDIQSRTTQQHHVSPLSRSQELLKSCWRKTSTPSSAVPKESMNSISNRNHMILSFNLYVRSVGVT